MGKSQECSLQALCLAILRGPEGVLDIVQIQMDFFLVKQEVMTIHESFWAFLNGVVGPL